MQRPLLFPSLAIALWITLLAPMSFVAVRTIVALLSSGGSRQLAEGLGLVVGFGGVGTIAARYVPPPQAERLGLRGMRLRLVLPLLLLIPAVLLVSELDNVVRAILYPAAGSEIAEIREKFTATGALEVLEATIVAVGIQPVVSEWFYRGVVQQGLVAQLGRSGGIVVTALLYALALSLGAMIQPWTLWLAATVSEFADGLMYGIVRHYSGSLLAPILLHIALNASGHLALGFATRVPIPGFNAEGAHTPIQFLLPAAVSVALGLALLVRLGGNPGPSLSPETTADKGDGAPPR